jgi:hypothetical protein
MPETDQEDKATTREPCSFDNLKPGDLFNYAGRQYIWGEPDTEGDPHVPVLWINDAGMSMTVERIASA